MSKTSLPGALFAIVWHLSLLTFATAVLEFGFLDIPWNQDTQLMQRCFLAGVAGGVVYCMRAIYLNYCKGKWGNKWLIWHVIRPFISLLCGGLVFLVLKAGLILLEAQSDSESVNYGYYALAALAGYNVGNFLRKIEEVVESLLGIGSSRSSKRGSKNPDSNNPGKGE